MPTNSTDYDLPDMWGQMTDEEKSDWFLRERVWRQARQQDTAFGRRYQAYQDEQRRLDTDQFRVDDDELQ